MSMGELDPPQRERLGVIRQSGSLLLAVLNDVLDLSKIEAGKLTLVKEDFDLETSLSATIESFGAMARSKGLDFQVSVADEARGWWRGDADRLRQIVGNLISNAVKFTPQGSVAARVDVNPDTGSLRLVVRDSGVGIAPEKLPALFEKFTQADNSATRRFGGTGLGLAICRDLAQLMGGEITAASTLGQGSTFTLVLPLGKSWIRLLTTATLVIGVIAGYGFLRDSSALIPAEVTGVTIEQGVSFVLRLAALWLLWIPRDVRSFFAALGEPERSLRQSP